MKHLDLFSGIGGFALAAQTIWGKDHEVVAFCEIDPFCQQVLKKHWPNAPISTDIRKLNNEWIITNTKCQRQVQCEHSERTRCRKGVSSRHREPCQKIDLLTGGFPCQPFSCAGQRRGKTDDRYLWPEMLRVIKEVRPRWIIGENVPGIIKLALDEVCTSLENEGYTVQPIIIPACGLNAPHRRDRVWIVAHCTDIKQKWSISNRDRTNEPKKEIGNRNSDAHNPISKRLEGFPRNVHGEGWQQEPNRPDPSSSWSRNWLQVATELCRMDDGLPAELDGFKLSKSKHRENRIKALGNAIAWPISAEIMGFIKEIDSHAYCG